MKWFYCFFVLFVAHYLLELKLLYSFLWVVLCMPFEEACSVMDRVLCESSESRSVILSSFAVARVLGINCCMLFLRSCWLNDSGSSDVYPLI